MICSRTGCKGEALWKPVVKMWAKGYPKDSDNAIVIPYPLVACENCREKLKISDVLGDVGYEQIRSAMSDRGLAAPDKNSAELEWTMISGGQA